MKKIMCLGVIVSLAVLFTVSTVSANSGKHFGVMIIKAGKHSRVMIVKSEERFGMITITTPFCRFKTNRFGLIPFLLKKAEKIDQESMAGVIEFSRSHPDAIITVSPDGIKIDNSHSEPKR